MELQIYVISIALASTFDDGSTIISKGDNPERLSQPFLSPASHVEGDIGFETHCTVHRKQWGKLAGSQINAASTWSSLFKIKQVAGYQLQSMLVSEICFKAGLVVLWVSGCVGEWM